eukprot:133852-Prorocentrum_minimum.AAC.5
MCRGLQIVLCTASESCPPIAILQRIKTQSGVHLALIKSGSNKSSFQMCRDFSAETARSVNANGNRIFNSALHTWVHFFDLPKSAFNTSKIRSARQDERSSAADLCGTRKGVQPTCGTVSYIGPTRPRQGNTINKESHKLTIYAA